MDGRNEIQQSQNNAVSNWESVVETEIHRQESKAAHRGSVKPLHRVT